MPPLFVDEPSALGALYARALANNDVDSMVIDGDSASLSGLILAKTEIFS